MQPVDQTTDGSIAPSRARPGLLILWALLVPGLMGIAQGAKQGLPRALYQTLERSHRLLADGQPGEALGLLARARAQAQGAYPQAVVLQSLGYAQLELERLPAAAKSFAAALALEALPARTRDDLRYNLAQILARIGRSEAAMGMLEAYLDTAKHPTLKARLLLGQLYLTAERYPKIPPLLEGVVRRLKGQRDKEQVLRLLVAAYSRLGQHQRTIAPLKTLVAWFPQRREYWLRLAEVYLALEREADALSVLEGAWLQGRLTRPSEIEGLARLYLRQGVPYKAAELLEKALGEGTLDASPGNLRLTAQAWQMAREQTRTLAALKRVLAQDSDPVLAQQLAYLHLNAERWEEAAQVLRRALERGPGKERGKLLMLLGVACHRSGRPKLAREAFAQAEAVASEARQARQWMEFLDYLQRPRGTDAAGL